MVFDKVMDDYKEYMKSEKGNIQRYCDERDEYKNFLDRKEDDLEKAFNISQNFVKQALKVLKIRGILFDSRRSRIRARLNYFVRLILIMMFTLVL